MNQQQEALLVIARRLFRQADAAQAKADDLRSMGNDLTVLAYQQDDTPTPITPPSHVIPRASEYERCGCLTNPDDAHRVGCPTYPAGKRGAGA